MNNTEKQGVLQKLADAINKHQFNRICLCKDCKHWSNNKYDSSKDNFRECNKLQQEEKMFGWSQEDVPWYETSPDFGCVLWEKNDEL